MGLEFDEAHFDRTARRFLNHSLPQVVDLVLRKGAFDVIAGTAERWPVDTGRSRAGWRAGLQRIDPELGTNGGEVSVTNPVSYVPALEYGTPEKEGLGILQSEVRRARADIAKVAGRMVLRAWRGAQV